ncbi:MAG TPA: hypothetical protein VF748_15075 [Candidatus Acidoferrum sp.]
MPYFYDMEFGFTVTTAETTQMAGKNVAAGSVLGIYGLMMNARSLTAGGASARTKTNTAGGTVFSGGTAQTPTPKEPRAPAAQSTWVNAGTAITAGTTLLIRNSVGFAQTGGQGGMQPITPQACVIVEGGTTPNPVDVEFTNISSTASVAGDMTLEIGESL